MFSGASVAGGMHLFDKLYGSLSVNGIYAMFAKDETQKFDLALSPQLNYVLNTKNKKILINAGVLFPMMGVVKKDVIPTFSLTYLLN